MKKYRLVEGGLLWRIKKAGPVILAVAIIAGGAGLVNLKQRPLQEKWCGQPSQRQ